MERGQIVALATVVIPPENTPRKKSSETLTAHPQWKYVGPADTIRFEWQIGRKDTFFNGITARKYSTRSQPAAMELKEFSTSLPAISLSALSAGYYDCEIWFKDKFSDLRVIIENCVEIVEVAPPPPPASDIADWDFRASGGTYDLGAKVTFDASYKYKGKAQSGYLTISLGTGAYPSFFTKHTFSRVSVTFDEAMDWTPGSLSGSFTLPTTLKLGQTYSVRAKLETADGAQETDTDWGVITITEAPPPPERYRLFTAVSPSGTGWAWKDPIKYDYAKGEVVKVTAEPRVGYKFDHWDVDGDYLGTRNPLNFMVMAEHTLTANFSEVAPPPEEFTLVVTSEPSIYGRVTREPSKATYPYGEWVKVTAIPYSGRTFSSWEMDGEWLPELSNPFNTAMTRDHTVTAHFR